MTSAPTQTSTDTDTDTDTRTRTRGDTDTDTDTRAGYRSKSLATWIAVIAGTLGLHRVYLRGAGDLLAWLHVPLTALGVYGMQRMQVFGQDDRLAWVLIPVLGLMVSQAMLCAIVYGLTSDEKWDSHHNPGQPVRDTGWGPVLGVIAALLLGAAVLMGTIAFAGQKYFETQLDQVNNSEPT